MRGIQTILILECLGGPDIRNVSLDNERDRYRRNCNLINYTKEEFIVSGWERKRTDHVVSFTIATKCKLCLWWDIQ